MGKGWGVTFQANKKDMITQLMELEHWDEKEEGS